MSTKITISAKPPWPVSSPYVVVVVVVFLLRFSAALLMTCALDYPESGCKENIISLQPVTYREGIYEGDQRSRKAKTRKL